MYISIISSFNGQQPDLAWDSPQLMVIGNTFSLYDEELKNCVAQRKDINWCKEIDQMTQMKWNTKANE